MTADYFECLKRLNVTGIDHFPKATEHVGGMIAMMERLIAKGYAYPAGGDVYFDIAKDADYGKLCNRQVEHTEAGERNDTADRKRNPGDFALWKGAKPGEPAWESPWGQGRPGWHIECSVMSQALLGDTLDIHGGGLDLQFPHHENELAQSESDTDKPFARVWMHNGLLKLRDKDGNEAKMSGSLGNVLNVVDAIKHVSGEALRFFLLSTHYRSPIDLGVWDWHDPASPIPAGIVAAAKSFETFTRLAERFHLVTGQDFYEIEVPSRLAEGRTFAKPEFAEASGRFREYMDDDFNTGGAVAVLFELASSLNRLADAGKLEDPTAADPAAKAAFRDGALLLKELARILGLYHQRPAAAALGGDDRLVAGLMNLLIELRNNLRAEAKKIADKADPVRKALFDQTDLIRRRLAEASVTLEDRPGGTTWKVDGPRP